MVALLAILALAAVLRFAGVGEQSFWADEFATIAVLDHGFGDLFSALRRFEATPPAYYFGAFGWREVFGGDEAGLRAFSALAGTATVPAVYAAGRALAGARAGLIAGLLTATSPLLVWYSQEARAYALLAFAAALSFMFFAMALRDDRGRWAWAWAVASALALVTHYFAFLLVVPEAALLLRRRGWSARALAPVAAVAAAGALLIPLAAEQSGRTSWVAIIDVGERLAQIPQHFAAGLNSPWELLPPLLAAGLALVAVVALSRAGPDVRRAAGIAGVVALGGAGLALLAALIGEDFVLTRNLLALWPPVAVAVGVALAAPRTARLGLATALLWAGAGVALVAWNASTPAAQHPDWDRLAALAGSPPPDGALAGPREDVMPLLLYWDDATTAPIGEPLAATSLDLVSYRPVGDHGIGPCWWGVVCGGRRLFVPDPVIDPPPGLRPTKELTTDRLFLRRYRASRPVELSAPAFDRPYIVAEE